MASNNLKIIPRLVYQITNRMNFNSMLPIFKFFFLYLNIRISNDWNASASWFSVYTSLHLSLPLFLYFSTSFRSPTIDAIASIYIICVFSFFLFLSLYIYISLSISLSFYECMYMCKYVYKHVAYMVLHSLTFLFLQYIINIYTHTHTYKDFVYKV